MTAKGTNTVERLSIGWPDKSYFKTIRTNAGYVQCLFMVILIVHLVLTKQCLQISVILEGMQGFGLTFKKHRASQSMDPGLLSLAQDTGLVRYSP